MLRAEQGVWKVWHIETVVELDGVEFTGGILDFEAEGASALNAKATSNTTDRTTQHRLQIFETLDITRHGDGAKSINTNFEGVGIELGTCSGVVDGLISNNLLRMKSGASPEPVDPMIDGGGGEATTDPTTAETTQTSADEALHATTNLEEANEEAPGKHHCFVLPCEMEQLLWFSEFSFFLPFHS
jgi:hypothetical protein